MIAAGHRWGRGSLAEGAKLWHNRPILLLTRASSVTRWRLSEKSRYESSVESIPQSREKLVAPRGGGCHDRIDFVSNMYRAMAKDPSYLDVTWKKIKSILKARGKLDRKTQD
jgi:hypothetical protein